MKRAIAILLAILILSISLKDLAIYALFKANQEYLVANRCINRLTPEALCFATCVLTETLIESQEQQDRQSGITVEQQVDMVYLTDRPEYLPTLPIWQQAVMPSKSIDLLPALHTIDIFQPPEC